MVIRGPEVRGRRGGGREGRLVKAGHCAATEGLSRVKVLRRVRVAGWRWKKIPPGRDGLFGP